MGIELLVGYGLTETSPVVSCRRPWRNIRGSSGLPMPQTEFRIVDPDNGQPLGFRQRGRVMVRGPQVMAGYLGKPEASAKVSMPRDGLTPAISACSCRMVRWPSPAGPRTRLC